MEISKTPDYQGKFDLYNEKFNEKYEIWFNNLKPEEKDDYKSSILSDGKKSRSGRPQGAKNRKRKHDEIEETKSKIEKYCQVPNDLAVG